MNTKPSQKNKLPKSAPFEPNQFSGRNSQGTELYLQAKYILSLMLSIVFTNLWVRL